MTAPGSEAPKGGGLDESLERRIDALIRDFLSRRDGPPPRDLAADQLLNAVYMILGDPARDRTELINALWRPLTG